MTKRTLSLPLLAVVAVVALVLGSFGTATAGGALTKGQVKKIATKVVKKAAPNLSVKSAQTAGTATTATTAGNATNLNGQPSTTYLDRIAFVSADSGETLPVPGAIETQVLGPLSITVPNGVSFAHVTGTVTLAGGGGHTFYVYAQQDVACGAAGLGLTNRVYDEYLAQGAGTFDFVFPVTPGAHSYRLCVLSSATTAYNRTLTVETVPTGATGGSTITRPSSDGGAADTDGDLSTAD